MSTLGGPGRAKAWANVIDDPFPGRSEKPRTQGLTMVIDKGLTLAETESLLELAGDYVDYLKLAFGTSALYDERLLRKKIALARAEGVDIYPGGTFLEVALLQGRVPQYVTHAASLGFTAIEVSDGTIPLSLSDRGRAITEGRRAGLKVITEVGKKDVSAKPPLAHLREQMAHDLDLGASHVIVEGRESGKGVGVYDSSGAVIEIALEELVAEVPDQTALIWETPLKAQQERMISRFGPNVNLGNIPPQEVIALEALRRGLRGDTLKLYLERR